MAGRKKTGGRQKGVPNKITRDIRQAIQNAFEEVGGEKYLVKLAQDDPRVFVTLLGKIMPTQIEADVNSSAPIVMWGGEPNN